MRGRKRVTIFALLALLGAVALLAAGCGGSDSESVAEETTIETTTETETEDTTSEDTTSEHTTDDSGLSPFASEDCLELVSIGSKLGESLSGTGDVGDVETFFQTLADKAPDEIKDDLLVLAEAMGEYAEAFKDIDLTGAAAADPETIQKLQELASKFDDAKYTEASQNIQTWAEENCSASG